MTQRKLIPRQAEANLEYQQENTKRKQKLKYKRQNTQIQKINNCSKPGIPARKYENKKLTKIHKYNSQSRQTWNTNKKIQKDKNKEIKKTN